MQKILAFIIPPFLKKIDRYLLLNYPRFWATKLHYVIFYGLLMNIFVSLFALVFFRPGQLRDFSAGTIWIVILAEAAVLLFWFNIQSWFNLEQEYGNTHYAIGFIETIIYTLCTILIFSPALVMLATGIYKITYLDTNEKNMCDGPRLLDFYYGSELTDLQQNFDVIKVKDALGLVQNALNSGTVKEDGIWIELAVVKPEEKQTTVFQKGDWEALYNNKKIVVEDGEAIIKAQGGEVLIEHENIITRETEVQKLEIGEEVTVNTGNEIKYGNQSDASQDLKIEVESGKIRIRVFYTWGVGKNQEFLIEKGKEIEPIMGESTVIANGGAWFFNSKYSKSYSFCQSVQNPSEDNFRNDNFSFLSFLVWQVFLIILGVIFLQILKYSNWRILIFSFLYVLFLLIMLFTLYTVLGYFPIPDIEVLKMTKSEIIADLSTSVVFLFTVIQSTRSIRTKKYNLFAFISFVSLPLVLGLGGVGFLSALSKFIPIDSTFSSESRMSYLIVCFLIYLFFTPIQKKILIYLMSLPRK